ncbi:MAG: alpha/beta hydrolase [Candidatus Binataceae bacterium]|jgi:pimeloyl-ACP methyl ester carboxylesterase
METRTFKGAGGLALNAIDYGGAGKPPLLLIHGGSAHAHWWDFVGPAMTDRFHAIALDQRGHGDSPWMADWAYGSRHYVEDLEAVIGSWGLGRPVLVGHSMGGHNVTLYAGWHGETLLAVAAIDSPASYPQEAKDMLKEMAERPGKRFDSLEEAVANFRTIPNQTNATPEVLAHTAKYSFRQDSDGKWMHKMDRRTMIREPISVWEFLPKIQCPMLYVRAGISALQPWVPDKIISKVPNGRVTVVPDSHHHVLLDNPAGLVKVLREFLDGIA